MALRIVLRQFQKQQKTIRNNLITNTGLPAVYTLIPAGSAHVYRDLTFLQVTNTSVNSHMRVDISDGTITYSWLIAANGGGFNINFSPPLAASTPGTAWIVDTSSSGSDVRFDVEAVETY